MREGSTLYYLFSDHLGSTSIVTNDSGSIVSEQKYKAWGETRYTSGTNPSEYTYTGQYSYTNDFGLMYYNARFYDPSLGRFAQADSIIPSGLQGLDRYTYVGNNPVNYIDPSGNVPVDCYGTDYCGSNFASVILNSGEAPSLTSSSDPGFNDLYSGEELYQVFELMKGCADCWWNVNGDFTIETFIGFIIMAEGSGDEQAYKALEQIYAQRLYVGGGSGETGPYCPSGTCFNGVFNYLAATSGSARFLIQSYHPERGNLDIHRYMGPQSIGLYSLQGNSQEVEQAITTANNLGGYALQPTTLYGFNIGPSEYGLVSMGGKISEISSNVRNSSTYIPEYSINGLSTNLVYLYANDAFYYSINQQNYWLGQ
jgi:RHS repeat-associated protein